MPPRGLKKEMKLPDAAERASQSRMGIPEQEQELEHGSHC